jgi:hypothetical protein
MTHKLDLNMDWKLRTALKEIVDKNCIEIPYEGTTVDKEEIVNMFLNYLKQNHYSVLKHDK